MCVCIYIYTHTHTHSLLLSVVKNKDHYKSNKEIHSTDTRYNPNLHPPISYLTIFLRGDYYFGIEVFILLPSSIKSLSNEIKLFRRAFKRLLLSNSFYSID